MKIFWDKVDIRGPSECWDWIAGKWPHGYGAFTTNKKQYRAHRMAYILSYGEIPAGALVLHSCDNKACCNPSHLRVGTAQDNMDDRRVRGRENAPKGERHFMWGKGHLRTGDKNPMYGKTPINKILTDVEIKEAHDIYCGAEKNNRGAVGVSYESLGKRYGVARTSISRAITKYRRDNAKA